MKSSISMLEEIKQNIIKGGNLREPFKGETVESVFFQILHCRFKNESRIHNWEKYIDNFYKKNWTKLSEETRLVMFENASKLANWEHWD